MARAQAVGEFEVLVQQVQKNAALVEHAVGAIAHARACAAPPAGPAADLQELQEHIEAHRVKACCRPCRPAEQPSCRLHSPRAAVVSCLALYASGEHNIILQVLSLTPKVSAVACTCCMIAYLNFPLSGTSAHHPVLLAHHKR